MKAIIKNDLAVFFKGKITFILFPLLVTFGFLVGFKFNISVGEGIYADSPYAIGYMTALMSLSIILISTLISYPILFKEDDSNFGLIVFTTPIKKFQFAKIRFLSFYLLSLTCFLFLEIGYLFGIQLQSKGISNPEFHLSHFIYAFIVFGVINTFMVTTILYYIKQKFRNKLLVALTGLFLYISYMIALMFSNSPFMAQFFILYSF